MKSTIGNKRLLFFRAILLMLWALSLSSFSWAETFALPRPGNDMVGQVQTYIVQRGDNFPKIAQQFGVTYTGLVESNPGVNPERPRVNTVLTVPSGYVLPNVPRKGIIINLAELRLYYYPAHQQMVYTYPVGIGIENWTAPLGLMKIVQKKKDPTWYVPVAVHEELAKKGFHIPMVIPPGPDNPLGGYMLRLSEWTYLIHGVVDPTTVGRRSSSGCIRMYPHDIQELFANVPVGTPVRIINEPYKVGWNNGKLYLEAHTPLQEQQVEDTADFNPVIVAINGVIKNRSASVQWDNAFALAQQSAGVPMEIGEGG